MTIQTVITAPATTNRPIVHRPITGEELYRMPGIGSSELVRGEIVERMPTGHLHGDVEISIGFFLKSYVREHKLGKVFGGETGVFTGREPDTVRDVDVAYISFERFQQV